MDDVRLAEVRVKLPILLQTVDHRTWNQDCGSSFLRGLVNNIRGSKLKRCGVPGVNIGGLDKLSRDRGFGCAIPHRGAASR